MEIRSEKISQLSHSKLLSVLPLKEQLYLMYMFKHTKRILPTVRRLARPYSTPKDDFVKAPVKFQDVIDYGVFLGTGAGSLYGICSIIDTSIERSIALINKNIELIGKNFERSIALIDKKLEKLDKLDTDVGNIKGYLKIMEKNSVEKN
ncbi:23564_t:CDS:2 [Entrophospora sp. SA101]|nr:23564_t:CDS:2 [Entrophospora sp. SA101]